MNRRTFITLSAAVMATTALPAQGSLTEATALSKARSIWGKYAYVHLRIGAYARAANRPNGEYCIGYKNYTAGGSSQYWYGDSWEDAFDTFEKLGYGDPKMLGFTPTLGRDYPGPCGAGRWSQVG